MFGAFKIPGTGNNASGSTNVNNSPGTGNSIFGAMGFAVPIMTAAPTTNTAQQTTDKTTAESDDLPPGWRLVNSRQSGREYYVHIASGHTQWDKPTESEPKSKYYRSIAELESSLISTCRNYKCCYCV